MGKIDQYLTYLIHLELHDHKTQVTVMSVIDALLDIRNEIEASNTGVPFDGDALAKAKANNKIC
jgi:hypothetical protein